MSLLFVEMDEYNHLRRNCLDIFVHYVLARYDLVVIMICFTDLKVVELL